MSYAHVDCSRQILRLLLKQGDTMTRSELNAAVQYHGKNETNFGATLVDLVQGGLLEENRIPKLPTQYVRTAKQVPAPEVKVGMPARRIGKSEAVRQEIAAAEKAGSPVIVLERPQGNRPARKSQLVLRPPRGGADIERAMQRRAKVVELLGKQTSLAGEISDATGIPRVTLNNDLTWLKKKGYIQYQADSARGGNVYSLTKKTFEAPAAEAAAAEPAAPAPIDAAAPDGAADPEFARWKEIDDVLEGAYVYAKKALHLHRLRRPS